ncbi:ORF6N domain-containing protein [bacterium]|nr:ORF6N domain-containing protein [bacterium]
MNNIIPAELIAEKIFLIRGKRVMLDRDLSMLYDVETRTLKQAVKRNIERFPEDFMFTLSNQEFRNLRSQTVTSSYGGTL